MSDDNTEMPNRGRSAQIARGALQVVGGAIPFAGGLFSAAAGAWSEEEQRKVNEFFQAWLKMLQDEMKEKQETILQITARLDMHDKKVADRIASVEYQSLLKKAFRNWSGTESQKKREYVRNILSNTASATFVSDDVVSLFLDWLHTYSEFHFTVIASVYNNAGATRSDVWEALGKEEVRENSAEADLFKLLFRDLSTGGVIRQHRETDYHGNFVTKPRAPKTRSSSPRVMKSAFDDKEQYELTALGKQFVHYAMTDVPTKIDFTSEAS